ncbi:hypothetical protein PENFLA_c014G09986 [Penicillium flavigenum]|uniref:Berberine/berberine-like domain-containing protein n=1 Tax=Penicillium flavigenum TaxID=254877 RepID=A0A1V6T5G7_9EURO|nr:hypothetical protein PENFLA_c014G09986 [Penicillium flavigenum]
MVEKEQKAKSVGPTITFVTIKPKSETNTKPKPETKDKSDTKTKSKPETKSQAKLDSKPKLGSDAKPKPTQEAKTKAETKSKAKPDANPRPKPPKLVCVSENFFWKFYSNLVIFKGQIILEGIFFGSKEEYDELDLEKRFPTSEPGTVLVLTDWLGMIGYGLEDRILKVTNPGTLVWFVTLSLEGGAINSVSEDATAYGHRDVLFWFQVFVVNPLSPIPQTTYDFTNGLYDVLAQAVPESAGHAYLGCPDLKMPDPQHAYWRSNLPRLEELKEDLDPKDTFHNPQGLQFGP